MLRGNEKRLGSGCVESINTLHTTEAWLLLWHLGWNPGLQLAGPCLGYSATLLLIFKKKKKKASTSGNPPAASSQAAAMTGDLVYAVTLRAESGA